jgi:hypothetical protein
MSGAGARGALRSSLVIAALASPFALLEGIAHADVQACIAAFEKGQKSRREGKLREAREYFLACGVESCPALVRHDCAQYNGELMPTIPTVVFGARDKQGRDLFDVTVAMDGEVLVKKLDGKSVTVDPGKHTFKFEAAGYPTLTETALIKEGERARNITVTFDNGSATATTSGGTGAGTGSPSADGDKGNASHGGKSEGGHTPYPWIVVGVGAVGVVVGAIILATSPDVPPNCNEVTKKCTRATGQNDADFRAAQEQAGTADSQPVLGLVVAGIGLAVVAGGLAWHFLEPTGAKAKAAGMSVTPWTTGQSSGFALGGRF